jgi:hypothetical protein
MSRSLVTIQRSTAVRMIYWRGGHEGAQANALCRAVTSSRSVRWSWWKTDNIRGSAPPQLIDHQDR